MPPGPLRQAGSGLLPELRSGHISQGRMKLDHNDRLKPSPVADRPCQGACTASSLSMRGLVAYLPAGFGGIVAVP